MNQSGSDASMPERDEDRFMDWVFPRIRHYGFRQSEPRR